MKRFRVQDAKAIEGPYHWFSDPDILATKILGYGSHSGKKAGQIQSPAIRLTLLGPMDPPSALCCGWRYLRRVMGSTIPIRCDRAGPGCSRRIPPQQWLCRLFVALGKTWIQVGDSERSSSYGRSRRCCGYPGLGYGDAVRIVEWGAAWCSGRQLVDLPRGRSGGGARRSGKSL